MNFKRFFLTTLGSLLSFNITAYQTIFYRLISILLIPLDFLFEQIEKLFIKPEKKLKDPRILFVIGLHRSGATVVAQHLNIHLDLNNFSNYQILFKRSAYIHQYFKSKVKKIIFRNFYGNSFLLSDVSDLNEFWNFHLNIKNNEFIEKNFKPSKKIYDYLQLFYSFNKKIILIKNGRGLFIVKQLSKLFKKSYFIIVDRDIKLINKSVKNARKVFFNYDWGLKTNREKYTQDITLSARNRKLKKILIDQLKKINKNRYTIINFEGFKKNKIKKLKELEKKINAFFK